MTFAEWGRFLRQANITTNLAVGTGLLLLGNATGLLFWLLAAAQYRWWADRTGFGAMDLTVLGLGLLLALYVLALILKLLFW